MSRAVFDASAILAVYHNEPGKKQVLQYMDQYEPFISSVNLAEVYSKLSQDGLSEDEFVESFEGLEITVVDFDKPQAVEVSKLYHPTRSLGLSLGDRACLALAVLKDATAVTADRSWSKVAVCKIKVIR